ncbi:FitA-like ribbon-helix-helix domain-containing protein [Actinomyces slackii]|uniref:Antitoxin FitA-like ribbon-helix-helix domain-containing protein n=1 Tax=Actinomyces slackii TaxID=52774 RepID=A0A3S5EM09_9ACTO|nr:hypothetical protein [Actinomyces slackii]VEG73470.1 Uncharacterised protein [Actinomyces slackii]
MATLYVRDVADSVAEELKVRAAEEGMSLSAYVSAELTRIASRPTNARIVQRLRSKDRSAGPTTEQIVTAVRQGRE